MKFVLITTVLLFTGSAFAQDPPIVGNEQPVQVKPSAPAGCTPLGIVEGRKLWTGDCIANRPRSAAFAQAPKRNQANGPIGARRSKRIDEHKPIDAAPRVEEKAWWDR